MDFIITNGTIVDGTGAAPFIGDVVRDLSVLVELTARVVTAFGLRLWLYLSATRCAAGEQAIRDGRIAAVGVGLVDAGMTAKEIYDATGQHVAPGWIDPHTHFVRFPPAWCTVTVG